MREEIKRRWCQALRSGQYDQHYAKRLKLNASLGGGKVFSPLGVLADILETGCWGRWENNRLRFKRYVSTIFITNAMLNEAEVSQFHQRDVLRKSTEKKWDFPEIADYIEEEL